MTVFLKISAILTMGVLLCAVCAKETTTTQPLAEIHAHDSHDQQIQTSSKDFQEHCFQIALILLAS
jgi:hypothetical protein